MDRIKSLVNSQFGKLGIYGFGQMFNLVTPLLIMPYIVAVCGEENFGKVAIGLSMSFFFIVFVDYGTDLSGVKEVAVHRNDPAQLKKILALNYISRLVTVLPLLATLTLLYMFVPFLAKEKHLYIMGLSILIGQYLSPVWFLQGIENVVWITWLNIISKVAYVLFVFIFIKSADDYIYINFFFGLGMVLAGGFFLLLILVKFGVSPADINANAVKDYLRRNFSIFGSQVFTAIQLNAPVLVVGSIGGNLLAGQYKIIDQVILTFRTYIFLFFNYIFPKVCYLLQQDKKAAFKTWFMYNGANFIFVAASMAAVSFLAEFVVGYFNAKEIAYMASILRVAVFMPVFMVISVGLKQLVLGWDYNKIYIRITIVTVVASLAGIVLLLPHYGIRVVFYLLLFYEIVLIMAYLATVWNNVMSNKIGKHV